MRLGRSRVEFVPALAVVQAMLLCASVAAAVDRTWTPMLGSNDFNDGANWSPAGAPAAGDHLTMSITDFVVLTADSASIDGLSLSTGMFLDPNGFALTVDDATGTALTTVAGVDTKLACNDTFESNSVDVGSNGTLLLYGGGALVDIDVDLHILSGGTVSGRGTLRIKSAVSDKLINSGTIRAVDGILTVTDGGAGGTFDLDGAESGVLEAVDGIASLVVDGSMGSDEYSGVVNLAAGNSITFEQSFESDTGTINFDASGGSATLHGADGLTFGGTINVNSGIAEITSDGSPPSLLESTAGVDVSIGATLDLGDPVVGDLFNLDGARFSGAGTINLNGCGNVMSDTTVGMDVATGVFDIGGDTSGCLLTIDPWATLEITASAVDDEVGGFSAGTIDVRGILTVDTPGPWKVGSGIFELTQTHPTYEPTLNGSKLEVDSAGTFYVHAELAHVNAPVDLYGTVQVVLNSLVEFNAPTLLSASNLTVDTSAINLRGATNWAGGSYTGPGRIRQIGDANVTSSTTIDVSSYRWDGLGGLASSTTMIHSGAVFRIDVNGISPSNSYQGHVHIEESASLEVVTTPGLWTLGGTATLNGIPPAPTASIAGDDVMIGLNGIVEGDGRILPTVTNTGTLRPGFSAGVLTVGGHYSQTVAGRMEIDVGGLIPIDEYDRVIVPGVASLGGTLDVSLFGGFTPTIGDSFTILAAGSVVGTFDTEILPAPVWTVYYGPTSVVLFVPEPDVSLMLLAGIGCLSLFYRIRAARDDN